ncbi:MAG TPA: D-alanyl-D-alanine carboxypeptidase family protein [Bacillales bacterium]|nr:D-alanyl-D-alanine carboxypeptidase family protein [Bacillales bacterium]
MLKIGFTHFLLAVIFVSFVPLGELSAQAASHPGVSARNAVLMEQESGRMLFGKHAHEKRRIASITKIMTAVLAIEEGDLDKKVTISRNAANTEGSSLYLQKGEHVRLKDLVYGLMLRSGNDAAVAIAEAVGGSVEGFTRLMNQKAAQIGMTDTRFANPHGLDDHQKMYSTAYDMALLMRYAMKNKTFREITSTKVHRVDDPDGTGTLVWLNKNKLLRMYPYATGGKTGYTRMAKRTLVSTAKKDGLALIAVTLNDPDDWDDHMNLFDWGFRTFDLKTVVEKGIVPGIENAFYSGKVYVKQAFRYPVTNDEKDELHTSLTLYEPPADGKWKNGKAPSPVGMVHVLLDDEKVADVPVYFREGENEDKGFWDFFRDVFSFIAGKRYDG